MVPARHIQIYIYCHIFLDVPVRGGHSPEKWRPVEARGSRGL